MFRQATRKQNRARVTLDGPAGSGKSLTALILAHALAKGGKIAAIDTERGSLSKYVGEERDGIVFNFDVVELQIFAPDKYTEMIQLASKSNYAVLIIDSLSHAWEGVGGALEKVGGNVANWKIVTPLHQRMVDAILQSPCHIITTMRSRMEHIIDKDESTGRITGVRKVGLAPIQRPGMEYEFDLVGDLDWLHIITISKSRCPAIDGARMEKPGAMFFAPFIEWLESGSKTIATSEQPIAPSGNGHTETPTLESLIAQYGAERVLAETQNGLPTTPAEWAKLRDAMNGEGQPY